MLQQASPPTSKHASSDSAASESDISRPFYTPKSQHQNAQARTLIV